MNTKHNDTKSLVLKALEEHKGSPVSGSVIATELGISRNAVWKAVGALRTEGHLIEGGGGGYILSTSSDVLTAEGITNHLKVPGKLIVLDTVDSTNKEAGRMAPDAPDSPVIIVANSQTEGKGRLGRSFYSPKDMGIYMSFLIRPNISLALASKMTIAASVAVSRAIEKVSSVRCGIKWVNDIYIEGKKVCGILTEAAAGMESGSLSHLITGIGINCHPQSFPSSAGSNPGWIPAPVPRNMLAACVANELLPLIDNPLSDDVLDYYRSRSIVIGRNIKIFNHGQDPSGRGISARATGIHSDGGLMVTYPDGNTEILTSGEITIRRDIEDE